MTSTNVTLKGVILSQREDFQEKYFNLPPVKRVLLLLLLCFATFMFLKLFNVSMFHTDRVRFFGFPDTCTYSKLTIETPEKGVKYVHS